MYVATVKIVCDII